MRAESENVVRNDRPEIRNVTGGTEVTFAKLAVGLLTLLTISGAWAAPPRTEAPTAPATLETLRSLEFEDRISWYLQTDLGTLHVYANDRLHTLDLMRGGEPAGEPLLLPGASERGSVVEVPGTDLLLATSARAGRLRGEDWAAGRGASREGRDGPRASYGIEALTGKIVWENEELPAPREVFVFEDGKLAVLRSTEDGRDFVAVALESGELLWKRAFEVQFAQERDGFLEIFGDETGRIEPRTGKALVDLSIDSGRKHRFLPFPEADRLVVFKGNNFEGYAMSRDFGRDVASGVPVSKPEPLWEFRTDTPMVEGCIAIGNCFVQPVAGRRLLVGSVRRFEMLDVVTGRVLWEKKKKSYSRDLPVSPSGRSGVEMSKEEIVVVDMETGADRVRFESPRPVEGSKTRHSLFWLGEDEILVVFHDEKWRPEGLARVRVSSRSIAWNAALPAPPKFRLTSRQKGALAGKIFAGIAVAAVGVAMTPSAAFSPFASSQQWMLGQLGTQIVATGGELVGGALSSVPHARGQDRLKVASPARAATRLRARAERLVSGERNEYFALTGEDDRYEVVAMDLDSGAVRTVGRYTREKVHSIRLDVATGLAVSVEDNEATVRVLGVPGRPSFEDTKR